jgi:ATP-dependent Clp protease protease subunit
VIKLRERYFQIIAEACKKDATTVTEDARRDFWLNAPEAHEYGLVDKVVTSRDELPE